MPPADVRRAVRYLLVVLVAYVLIAIGTGRGIRVLELLVFMAGLLALFVAANRLMDY